MALNHDGDSPVVYAQDGNGGSSSWRSAEISSHLPSPAPSIRAARMERLWSLAVATVAIGGKYDGS
jgi:hypothetical protein